MSDHNLRVVKDNTIDPDLVRLKRPHGVGHLLAFSVLGLALLLMSRLRDDFVFSNAREKPLELGRAVDVVAAGKPLPEDQLVAVLASLDFARAVHVYGRAGRGHRLVPALGTAGKLWV